MQNQQTLTEGQMPLAHSHAVERRGGSVARALLNSGMLSSFIFCGAMVFYIVGILFSSSKDERNQRLSSELGLACAWLFVLEALLDLRAVSQWAMEAQQSSEELSQSWVHCVLVLDFLSALFFLIPSIITTAAYSPHFCVAVCHWCSMSYVTESDFVSLANNIAAFLTLFNGVLGGIARATSILMTPEEPRLILFQIWKAQSIFGLDWSTWAAVLWLVGGILGVVQLMQEKNDQMLDWIISWLWFVDGVFYVVSSCPDFNRELQRCHDGPCVRVWA